MKKWIALIEQRGEGCDYTIGCGLKWSDVFEAEDRDAALEILRADMFGDNEWGDREPVLGEDPLEGDELALDRVRLIEIADDVDAPIGQWADEYLAKEAAAEAAEAEAKERVQYEELKRKFETKGGRG